jgi:phosphoribosylaminoimidazole-succinocarboxamide synthase
MLAERFLRSGKVRDLYELPDGRLLLVASDRISAFDVVLPSEIPDKGRVLTGLSRFWFAETAGLARNHLLGVDPLEVESGIVDALAARGLPAAEAERLRGGTDQLRGRIMLCRPAQVLPIEAVVRGYLDGSGWKAYQATGAICGVALPAGLRQGDRLPEPIFTPATKAPQGEHDLNIDFDTMIEHLERQLDVDGSLAGPLAEAVRERSLQLYRYGHAVAERAGILVADTKFEWGLASDGFAPIAEHLLLIDEVLTPDSSRFWDAAMWQPGGPQASYDKQFVRDWLEAQPWPKTAPGPALPDDVVAGTRARYVEAFERITGASFDRYLQEDVIAR